MCLTKEETEYVYSSVKNGTQVKPVHISKTVDRPVDVSINPYKEALTQEVVLCCSSVVVVPFKFKSLC